MILTTIDWLTLALVVITGFYAWATFRMLRVNEGVVAAMREQTEAQLRPNVVISVAPRIGTTLLCLTVKNTGRSPAVNLRMKFDRDFFMHGEKRDERNLAALSAFTNPIESLAPESQLIFILGVGGTIFGSQSDPNVCPTVFSIQATYQHGAREYAEKSTIDIRPMLSSTVEHDPVAEELKRLRESIERVAKRQ
jgi:hypothetical protein